MFEEVLKRNGWNKLWQDDDIGMHCFENDVYYLMVYQFHNITRVNDKETHDRWSIAEFEFNFVPYTERDYHIIHERLKRD